MNFLTKASVAFVATGASLAVASGAHAAGLTGTLTINGNVNVNSLADATQFTFVDSNGSSVGTNFNIGFNNLALDGVLGTVSGAGSIQNLNLDASGNLPAPITSFISNLIFNNGSGPQTLSFDLTSFNRGTPTTTLQNGTTTYFYNSLLSGVFKLNGSNAGFGSLTTTFTVSNTEPNTNPTNTGAYGGTFVATGRIPTPALLPGLLAMGAGVLMRRKASVPEESRA